MDDALCPVVIGRSAELDQLTAALDAAAAGRGGAVFVTGDEGVAKSRLARDLSALAEDRDFTVLTGRGTRTAVPVPYRPVAEALMGAARNGFLPEMPVISNFRAALGSLVPEWSRPGDGRAHVEPVVVGEAVLRLLTQPGHAGGLLVLEDLHWADPETLAIVEYLADNIGSASVLCVLTLRSDEPSAGMELCQSALARRVATAIEVPRLSPAGDRDMAAARLQVAELPAEAGRLLADCDGLPFAVEEILAAAVSSGELARDDEGWHVHSDVATGVPESIAGSVHSRLTSLGPEAGNVIVAEAVLGRQFDFALLPSLAGVGEAEALDALRRAREVQLIEPAPGDAGAFRFRHSLTRDAILTQLMPPELSARAAAAAASIIQAHPGLPGTWCELVAELYVLADQPLAAIRLLVTAGRRALLQGAVSSALAALQNARKLLADAQVDDPMLAIEVDEVMLDAFGQAGDHHQLAALAESLLALLEAAGADPRRRALVRLKAASTRPEDDPAAAADHLSAAAAIAAELCDSELAARIDAVAARNALAANDLDAAERFAREALATAESAGLSGWAAEVALEALEVLGRRERCRDLAAARRVFERSLQIADSREQGIWRVRSRHELSTLAMLTDGSAGSLSAVQDLAQETGALCVGTVITLQLANISSLSADLDTALAQAHDCQRAAAQIKAPRIEAMALCLQSSIAGIRGDREQAEQAARRAEEVVPGDPEILSVTWGRGRALTSLFRNEMPRAIREDSICAAYASQAFPSYPTKGKYSTLQAPLLAPFRGLPMHALLRAVAGDDGRAVIDQATKAGADTSWNAGLLAFAEAVVAGRAGERERASACAADGRAVLSDFAPWWTHLAWRLVAPLALQDRWGEPATWMREAIDSFETSGHDQLATACRGILRRAGKPVPRAGRGSAKVPAGLRQLGVTSREMDVFLLVARGKSNAEIAASLYISPKTVDTHVASLIAKTGKTSRRELVAHAARFELSHAAD